MKFEPGKFFIGVIDFFSILLPGALLTYALKDKVITVFFAIPEFTLDTPEHMTIFVFLSYLLGHFIFLLGAAFLDDHVYDNLRVSTYFEQVRRLARGEKLKSKFLRFLARHSFNSYSDRTIVKILQLKKFHLEPLKALDTMNAFKWCKTYLNTIAPHTLSSVERFEANSKFFRSLFIVFIIVLPFSIFTRLWYASLIIVGLIILSLWRYIDQRKKGIEQAYRTVIVLEANNDNGFIWEKNKTKTKWTHAGGLVYKGNNKAKREYLLLRATGPDKEWVLPKGHIDPGEQPNETAVREVKEETGIWAKVCAPIGKSKYEYKGEKIKVCYFLMECLEIGKSDENRDTIWLSLDECIQQIPFEETKQYLRKYQDDLALDIVH